MVINFFFWNINFVCSWLVACYSLPRNMFFLFSFSSHSIFIVYCHILWFVLEFFFVFFSICSKFLVSL